MIVLFIKSDLIRAQALPGHTCPNCHRTGDLTMELRQRYADFAGGKVYPNGVFGVVQCSQCGYTLSASRWTDDLHRAFVTLKADCRTSVTYWKGAIITAIGPCYASTGSKKPCTIWAAPAGWQVPRFLVWYHLWAGTYCVRNQSAT